MQRQRILLGIIVLCLELHAQYFGRNKIQYEAFDFKTMEAGIFDVLYYPPESLAVRDATRMLQRWRVRLDRVFGNALPGEQPVILYANKPDFQQTNAIPGLIPQGVGGVTEGLMNRIIIPLTGVYAENDHVLGHELVHAYHYAILRDLGRQLSAVAQVPLWYIEGMSEYLSLGKQSPLTAMWMRDAVLHERLPRISRIGRSAEYFPYRYGHAVWAYIAGRWGDTMIGPLYRRALRSNTDRAFRTMLGVDERTVSREWQEATRATFGKALEGRTPPEEFGRVLIEESEVNLSPSISPDGRYVAFLSSRGLFSIELYLADAETGKVIRQLTSALTDEHFDALRFIDAAGTWSPDGSRFAFVVTRDGDNAVSIVEVPSGETVRTFKVDDVEAIAHLAWSPNGRSLAVAGTAGAIGDLFLYDLETNAVTRLTNDRYAQLQPSWSPDGSRLAYVSDMAPMTSFDSLTFSPMHIGVMDVNSQAITYHAIADWATHTVPQFSPDGRELYFVANPDGIPNVFRYSFTAQRYERITNIATGISGLTQLSPSMSVAAKTGKIVCTVFSRSDYRIHVLESVEATPFEPSREEYLANVTLPPVDSDGRIVSSYLANATEGLPVSGDISTHDYRPGFRLYYIGQLAGGVIATSQAVGLSGGASFLWSDLLGNNIFGTSVRISGGLADIGAAVFYTNRKYRINYGAGLSHEPFFSTLTTFGEDTIDVDGDTIPVNTVTLVDRRVFEDRVQLWGDYPFSRNRRLEFSGSYTRVSYDYDAERVFGRGRTVFRREGVDVVTPSGLNLFSGGLAYVGDYSFFGFLSPVNGRRYRVEVEATSGSLTFLTALADWRQYVFIRPVTIAYRLFHFGRYLRDADDDRLATFFLGNETLVRGYAYYSFNLSRCAENEDGGGCPVFRRLQGARLAVANIELRFPLIGSEQFGLIPFPYVPVELVAFVDAGVAWSGKETPVITFDPEPDEQAPVVSAGGAIRVGVLGAFALQFYYARPFQRTDSDWEFGFLIAPGW